LICHVLVSFRSAIVTVVMQVPYMPDYKLAPEWHPVLELIQQQVQQTAASVGASHHTQVHKRIMLEKPIEQLRVADVAQHLRHAAAASAADAALSTELRNKAPSKILIGVSFAEVQQAELLRLKVKQESFHPAAAAAVDWEAQLEAVVMASERSHEHKQLCKPELLASSPWELDVAVCPQVRPQQPPVCPAAQLHNDTCRQAPCTPAAGAAQQR
jgi:putative alpha-1,2-mannosidase